MSIPKIRLFAAIALFSASFVCTLHALSQQEYQQRVANCHADRMDCGEGCRKNYAKGLIDFDGLQSCDNQCEKDEAKCVKKIEFKPEGTPPPRIGGLPTPTPRPGPSATAPPNKSNPSPRPRRGPGKAGTSGVGQGSPTATPSGPTLLQRSGKASPTPRPSQTPRHNHGHGH